MFETSTGEPNEEVRRDARFQTMEDVEMVLRFFAHRQRDADGAARRLKPFLDQYWRTANRDYSVEMVEAIGAIFVATINLTVDVLGDQAFWIRRDRSGVRSWIPRPTLLAYDSVMSAFSEQLHNAELLRERSERVLQGLQRLYDANAADFDGRRTDPQDLLRRDGLIKDVLERIVAET